MEKLFAKRELSLSEAEVSHKTVELFLPSPAGELEAILTQPVPDLSQYPAVAVICHPHPLYGGTMHGKVMVTASHAFLDLAYLLCDSISGALEKAAGDTITEEARPMM